jgi:hypothetical protein
MKMKFCAVSPSLPLLESGESMSALKGAGFSEERGFPKAQCPLIVVVGSKRSWFVMEVVVYTCLVPSQRVFRHNGSADHL